MLATGLPRPSGEAPDSVMPGASIGSICGGPQSLNKPPNAFRQDVSLTAAEIEQITGGHDGVSDAPCPLCSEARTPAHRAAKVLRIYRDGGFASWNCKHCGSHGGLRLDDGRYSRRPRLRPFTRPVEPERLVLARAHRAERVAFAEALFFSAGSLPGTLGARYLAGRSLPGDACDLRFGQNVPFGYASGRTGPAMLAAIRDPEGRLCGVQATFVGRDGGKLRRTSFGAVGAGGAVRLRPAGEVLAVSEGVETALSLTVLEGLPCWACLGTAGLSAFRPPPGLRRLVIAADNDANGAGLKAARALAERVRVRLDVQIAVPDDLGDFNDVLLAGRAS